MLPIETGKLGGGGEPIDVGGWEMGESGGGSGVKRGEKLGGHHVNPFSLKHSSNCKQELWRKTLQKKEKF